MALPPIVRRPLEAAGFLAPLDAQPGQSIAPIREASPEDDDAPPSIGDMVSRSGEGSWIPAQWLKSITLNPDENLARGGEGLKFYDRLLTDDTAMSTLQQRRLAITSRDWEVVPGDDKDPRSVKAADDFRAMIDALGFDRVTGLLHYGVWYGYAVGEGLYRIKGHDGRLIVWLDDIVVPDRRHFGFTMEGELRQIGELGLTGEDGAVPPNKFVTIRTGGTHDFAFYGLGLAHWCYWPIFFKRAALKFWALYLEKFGAPTVGIEFDEADAKDPIKKSKLLGAASAFTRDSAVAVPKGYITDNRIKIFEASRSGSGASSYKDFVGEQNEAIMRVVLGQPGTSKGVSSGLNSDQASEHGDVKAEIVKADSDLITDALQRTFGKWITRWNHGDDVAAPILRRILDDGEDLNTTAERDVKLEGIGIVRTEDSVKATYGEGYEVQRETPEEKNARELALAQAKKPVALPSANDNDPAAQRRQRIAQFAAQGGESAYSPLYVSRKLLPASARALLAWAKEQGFRVTVPAEDLHVTVLYSKEPVDWFAMGEDWGIGEDMTVGKGGPRFVERLGHGIDGDDAPVVLRFASPMLKYRHESMIERGASSDYADFKPHITISYDAADVDLAKVEPFIGELKFGPEIFEPIRTEPADPAFLAFGAAEEEAIDRLVAALVEEANPVFSAMASELRSSLQGVTTVEGARVAILGAMENLPIERLAKLTALPMLAERAGAAIGADDLVTA